ncbi:uncharacterized protein LOC117305914 [Asterias rubens]|uniref:uncharacterized protein LOC117305914 n=1 Tax=Asterias rubens TaxID=7604 RepID=UPI0014554CFF|nr:uncharacterized protein LOC117305914 [Asterias rubens]
MNQQRLQQAQSSQALKLHSIPVWEENDKLQLISIPGFSLDQMDEVSSSVAEQSDSSYVPESESDSGESIEIPLAGLDQLQKEMREAVTADNTEESEEQCQLSSSEVSSTLSFLVSEIKVAQTTNDGKSRNWDKKQYCYFCGLPQAKLFRHIESVHKEEPDVTFLLNHPHGAARKKLLVKIRNLGNHKHNCNVLRDGKGMLVVAYRPCHSKAKASDYGPCPSCLAYFVRRELWRHTPKCPLRKPSKKSADGKPTYSRISRQSDLLKPPVKGVSSHLNLIIQSMKKDAVSLVVKTDKLILELAKREFMKVGHDVDQYNYLRTKLREMGRLLLQLRQNTKRPNASLESFINPRCLTDIVSAVHDLAGFDEERHDYKVPSLALKIGHTFNKCAVIVKSLALESEDKDKGARADDFKELCESNWEVRVSTHAHRTLSEAKRNNPTTLPTNADIVRMTKYLKDVGAQQVNCLNDGKENPRDAWNLLNETTLCQAILFNRRRQGEVSKMKLSDYTKKHRAKPDGMCILSKLEQSLCKMFEIVEVVGKRGRTVPLLLTPEMSEQLNLLIENRHAVGVASDNNFLFGRSSYSSEGHIRGSDCLRKHARLSGATNPNNLRSTKLRKHIATASQMLALSENQLELLASFMGHDLRIHREYYRVPDTVLRVAKLSKLFLALDKGTLPSQEGKTLDNIEFEDDTEESEAESDGEESSREDNEDEAKQSSRSSSASVAVPKGKKRPWNTDEVCAIQTLTPILSMRLPGKAEIEKVQKQHPALTGRTWRNIKDYCRNNRSKLMKV